MFRRVTMEMVYKNMKVWWGCLFLIRANNCNRFLKRQMCLVTMSWYVVLYIHLCYLYILCAPPSSFCFAWLIYTTWCMDIDQNNTYDEMISKYSCSCTWWTLLKCQSMSDLFILICWNDATVMDEAMWWALQWKGIWKNAMHDVFFVRILWLMTLHVLFFNIYCWYCQHCLVFQATPF